MNKQKLISTSKAQMLVLELPEGASGISLRDNILTVAINYLTLTEIQVPEGNWQHIGTRDQITEEIWQEVVDLVEPFAKGAYLNYFRQQEWDRNFYPVAIKSGLSLLRANEIWFENPDGEEPKYPSDDYDENEQEYYRWRNNLRVWRNFQAKVFDPSRTHFFINKTK